MSSQTLFMPAEWDRHRATWVAWPHNVQTWSRNLPQAQSEFVQLVNSISAGELVYVLASGDERAAAAAQFDRNSNVELVDIPTNDAWIRDYGPTFAFDEFNTKVIVNWKYNGWGEKYPPFGDDILVAKRIAERLAIPHVDVPLVVEGGAIEVDGTGGVLTTRSCLLNSNRNPKCTEEMIEATLEQFVGGRHTFWLPGDQNHRGLPRDDTNGHIDQLARFVSEDKVLVAMDESNSSFFVENRNALKYAIETSKKSIDIIEVLIPKIEVSGQPLPGSYLNFYFCNRGIMVPQFGDTVADEMALEIISAETAVDVIPLPSLNLSWGLGSFHCLTQQEPDFPV